MNIFLRFFGAKSSDNVTRIEITAKVLNLDVYASFSQPYPGKSSYDFKQSCKAGKKCVLVINKGAKKKQSEICDTMKDDSFSVAAHAVGPEDCKAPCTEDIDFKVEGGNGGSGGGEGEGDFVDEDEAGGQDALEKLKNQPVKYHVRGAKLNANYIKSMPILVIILAILEVKVTC